MLYNVIRVSSVPDTVFAHICSCPNYEVRFKPMNPNIEIVYVDSGSVELDILDRKLIAKERSFLILPHKYPMTFKAMGDGFSHIHRTVSAAIDEESLLVDEIQNELSPELLCVPVCLDCCKHTEKLLEKLNEIIRVYQEGKSNGKLKCGILVLELLCDIAEIAAEGNSSRIRSRQKTDVLDSKIKRYIEKNIDKKITLIDIAECTGKSPNYLNQVFQRRNNVSIISYANIQKMKKAAVLIVEEGVSVKDAARSVGITDANYFSRLFRKKMGMSISEYRDNSIDYTFSLIDFEKVRKKPTDDTN